MEQIKKLYLHRISKWLLLGGMLLILAFLLWWGGKELSSNFAKLLLIVKDKNAVEVFLSGWGIFGPLLYVLLVSMQVITIIIPGQVLFIVAGYLYGFWMGLALSVTGVVLTSQLVFVVARRGGKPFVERMVPPHILKYWDRFNQSQGFFFFFLLFLFPVILGNATNYIAALSNISFWKFFSASFLGRMPGLILITLISSHGLKLTWQQWIVIIPVTLALVVGGRILAGKFENRFQAST